MKRLRRRQDPGPAGVQVYHWSSLRWPSTRELSLPISAKQRYPQSVTASRTFIGQRPSLSIRIRRGGNAAVSTREALLLGGVRIARPLRFALMANASMPKASDRLADVVGTYEYRPHLVAK